MPEQEDPTAELLKAMGQQLKDSAAGTVGIEAALAAKNEGKTDKDARLDALIQILLPATSALFLQKKARDETRTDKEEYIAIFADLAGLLLTILAASQGVGQAITTKLTYSFLANYFVHGMYPEK